MDELTAEELLARLTIAEDALERSQRIAIASRYAGAVMHEVNNPLEALSNLIYLTKTCPEASRQVVDYMMLAEQEIVRIGHITRKTLSFYREQMEPRDLTSWISSNLRLPFTLKEHAARISRSAANFAGLPCRP